MEGPKKIPLDLSPEQAAYFDRLMKDEEEFFRLNSRRVEELDKLESMRIRQLKLRWMIFLFINIYLAASYIGLVTSGSMMLENIMSDWSLIIAAVCIYLLVAAVLFGFPYQLKLPESFSDIDRQHQESRHVSGNKININLVNKSDVESLVEGKVGELAEQLTEAFSNATDDLSGEAVQDQISPFEKYLTKITDELDYQITLADKKASGLLDRGILFLALGLVFFIFSIFMWQYNFQELSPLVVMGMVSCTVAFVVVEFLAAWFLKQYKGFIDTSLAYARVRSHYERCLLSYHAVKEFDAADDVIQSSKSQLLQFLDREAKWPSSKQLNSNDFNYMLESMASFTAVLDKMKSLVKRAKSTPANEKVE